MWLEVPGPCDLGACHSRRLALAWDSSVPEACAGRARPWARPQHRGDRQRCAPGLTASLRCVTQSRVDSLPVLLVSVHIHMVSSHRLPGTASPQRAGRESEKPCFGHQGCRGLVDAPDPHEASACWRVLDSRQHCGAGGRSEHLPAVPAALDPHSCTAVPAVMPPTAGRGEPQVHTALLKRDGRVVEYGQERAGLGPPPRFCVRLGGGSILKELWAVHSLRNY